LPISILETTTYLTQVNPEETQVNPPDNSINPHGNSINPISTPVMKKRGCNRYRIPCPVFINYFF